VLAAFDASESIDVTHDLGEVRIGENLHRNSEGRIGGVEQLAAMLEDLL